MQDGEYSVYQFFPDETYNEELRFVDAKTAVYRAKSIDGPGALLGVTAKVLITDGGDYTCFLWIKGQGIVFPTQEQCKAARP
jgi:hypothetical protein